MIYYEFLEKDNSKLINFTSTYPLALKTNNSRYIFDYRSLENKPSVTWNILPDRQENKKITWD